MEDVRRAFGYLGGSMGRSAGTIACSFPSSSSVQCNASLVWFSLAEAKNGAVVRKQMGDTPIAAQNAAAIEAFYEEHFNPYLSFHRKPIKTRRLDSRRCRLKAAPH